MNISGDGITPFALEIKPVFRPDTRLSLQWVQASNGNHRAVDRGATSDIYETEIEAYGTESVINNIIDQIQNNRDFPNNAFNMSGFNITEYIFGSNLDYTGTISVTILGMQKKRQNTWRGFPLQMRVRALSPSFTGAASLPSFKYLDYGFESDTEFQPNKIDSYSGAFTYQDHQSDIGMFTGTFVFSTANMILLLNYIRTQRGGTFTVTGINGVTEMFGPRRGGSFPYSAKLIGWQDMGMINVNYWRIRLTFAEEV